MHVIMTRTRAHLHDVQGLKQVEVVMREPDLNLLQLDLILVLVELVLTVPNHLPERDHILT